jgi:hypothetical protein
MISNSVDPEVVETFSTNGYPDPDAYWASARRFIRWADHRVVYVVQEQIRRRQLLEEMKNAGVEM